LKLALSMLCENPRRRTGLTTLFHEFVAHALRQFPDVDWVVFAGPEQAWDIPDPRVEVVRDFPANDRLWTRLWADHFRVGPAARRRGAQALLTVGFVPARAPLPVAMHVFTLHHRRGAAAQVGRLRAFYRERALRSGLRRAALVIANSEWTAGHLRAESPGLESRLLVSYEGLAHAQFRPEGAADERARLQRELGLPPEYLLWISNFYAYKQAGRLIAAYARLEPALRARFPLVMSGGEWQDGRARAEQEARRLGVGDDVKFIGWIDDRWLAALYRQARAYVLPSAEETFGKTVTEAMACGCPCVLNDIPVLREVAAGSARMVDFADPAHAAAELAAVCRDDGLAGQLRAAGLRRAGDFSYEKLTRERIGRIQSMLGGAVSA
jgi:glycosyltransferase involved in cell wall biosynthesis